MRTLYLAAILGGALIVGAFLRFDGLGEPSFWMDEILHQIITTRAAAEEPWWHWITGFEPENGPLYYATQLATRIGGTGETAARSAAALFGLISIALVFIAARRDRDACVAAILLAASPLHVYYSREARPYALLMLLTAAMIVILLRARSIAAAVLVLVAMAYTAAVSAPILAATAITAFAAALVDRDTRRWNVIVGIAAIALLAPLMLFYGGAAETRTYTRPPVFDAQFFDALARNFSVTALASPLGGRTALAILLLAGIGAVSIARRERRAGVVLIGMALLPMAVALTSLSVFDRWYAVRYVTPSLIGYVLLAGFGIAAIARAFRAAAPLVAVAIAIAIAAQTWVACRTEPWQKLHWRLIAQKIVQYAKPGDVVLAAEAWSGIPLDFYLARMPNRIEDFTAEGVELARRMNGRWLVSAGSGGDPRVRQWMCSHPLVLSSEIDNFRMHYAGDFLRERAQAPEYRAAAAALGDAVLYSEGWEGVEGSGDDAFRWAVGTHATIQIPSWGARERVVGLRILPLDHPKLPPQRIRVTMNGSFVTEFVPPGGWSEHSIAIRPIDGLNTLDFEFARATAPADVDPGNSDPRKLAAAFNLPRTAPFAPRIASAPFLDETNTWRHTRTRFTRLERAAVLPILGRLGFDPLQTWPRLARGELHLEDLAATIAYASDCMDDPTFVRTSFEILLGRAPGPSERNGLESQLRKGKSRLGVVTHIVRLEEFRSRVQPATRGDFDREP